MSPLEFNNRILKSRMLLMMVVYSKASEESSVVPHKCSQSWIKPFVPYSNLDELRLGNVYPVSLQYQLLTLYRAARLQGLQYIPIRTRHLAGHCINWIN